MRLQVFLSRSGICSRRKAFEYVQSGRVSVNGKVIQEPSFAVTPDAEVFLDGKIVASSEKAYVLLNKPAGVITTTKDKFAKRKITDILPLSMRMLKPAGRLDRDTTGLIILTNDGELAFRLTHPSFEVEKVYHVVLDKALSSADKPAIEKGVVLDGKKTHPAQIKNIMGNALDIVLHEGRKRQVRRMFSEFGYRVCSLSRQSQGSLKLGDLKTGQWRFLKKEEIDRLCKELKIK